MGTASSGIGANDPPERRAATVPSKAPARTAGLSDSERQLLRLMSEVGFGRLERISVVGGALQFGEDFRIVRDVKLGDSEQRRLLAPTDYALKREVREFLTIVRSLDRAVVRKVELRHGLPTHLQIEEAAKPSGSPR